MVATTASDRSAQGLDIPRCDSSSEPCAETSRGKEYNPTTREQNAQSLPIREPRVEAAPVEKSPVNEGDINIQTGSPLSGSTGRVPSHDDATAYRNESFQGHEELRSTWRNRLEGFLIIEMYGAECASARVEELDEDITTENTADRQSLPAPTSSNEPTNANTELPGPDGFEARHSTSGREPRDLSVTFGSD
ncbi:hypothetical protein FGADI_2316 [Fusarium gaditjirri]|uniref:Uncharacterized protein n=1 Tax=Fusarium gaditjirri TaxID=282569 RepID=A0A8H4X2H6_9HYPO|nr:hypothetical protein FGADI_2316 [Fusarium gaditjirri]